MCSNLLVSTTEIWHFQLVGDPPSQLHVCEANGVPPYPIIDHRVCISENGMLSDLTVQRKRSCPRQADLGAQALPTSLLIPTQDGVNYLSFAVNQGGNRFSGNCDWFLTLERNMNFHEETTNLIRGPKTREQVKGCKSLASINLVTG